MTNCARSTVSRIVLFTIIPCFCALLAIKLVSNSALCATSTASPQKSRNSFKTVSMVGAESTMASVMPVSFSILNEIGICGLTKVLNLSTIFPSVIFTAPISIMRSASAENPVVSRSNTTYVSVNCCPFGLVTICLVSSTR